MKIEIELSLLEYVELMPPILIRACAVITGSGKEPELKSLEAVVADSGLPRRTVQRLIYRKTWSGVKLDVGSKFISGCGLNILKKKEIEKTILYWAKKDFPYLSPAHKARLFAAIGK